MMPYKEVLARLTCDLSKERPLEHPWVVRTTQRAKRLDGGNDALSIASSYLFSSVLSSKSKRMHIDDIIEEQEQIIDRVKQIDDKLREQGADDVKSNKEEMIQRAINSRHVVPALPSIPESKEETFAEKVRLKPAVSKEEAKNQTVTTKHNSNEIEVLQKLMSNTEMMDEVMRLSKMMLEAKIDFRILEFLKRGINKEYDDEIQFITVNAFHKYWRNLIAPEVEHLDPTIEDKVLHFVTTNGGDQVDKGKLFTLIDFYQYFPFYVQRDRNFSKEMYYVMSSNTDGGYKWNEGLQKKDLDKLNQNKSLHSLLEYIHDKIKEKYPKMAKAYRFFDTDHKTAITKEEFAKGLSSLKIVLSEKEIDKTFEFLDKNNDGLLTYNEFCFLLDEKFKQLDPIGEYKDKMTKDIELSGVMSGKSTKTFNK